MKLCTNVAYEMTLPTSSWTHAAGASAGLGNAGEEPEYAEVLPPQSKGGTIPLDGPLYEEPT